MVIQIFGTKKCNDTKKAIRFFKERNIQIHFVDLNEKGVSKGELNNISAVITMEDLINTKAKEYKKLNLEYIIHDIEEQLLKHPLLFKTPITRFGKKATIAYEIDTWKNWIQSDKK